jgi:hypothetical protein
LELSRQAATNRCRCHRFLRRPLHG